MRTPEVNNDHWTTASEQIFWGEIAPYDHVVQIYENDEAFIDTLTGFITSGLDAHENIVVIATEAHLAALNIRLTDIGYRIQDLTQRHQYIPLDAETTLSKFMVNDWPDEHLFELVVKDILSLAKSNGGNVRAFGEMVAILWARGYVGATVRLEHLWSRFCEKETFCLFCAYPQNGFTQDAQESIKHICGAHSKMISGQADKNIRYKTMTN